MPILGVIFIFGCLVLATVALGLVFAMAAIDGDGETAFEGKAESDEEPFE